MWWALSFRPLARTLQSNSTFDKFPPKVCSWFSESVGIDTYCTCAVHIWNCLSHLKVYRFRVSFCWYLLTFSLWSEQHLSERSRKTELLKEKEKYPYSNIQPHFPLEKKKHLPYRVHTFNALIDSQLYYSVPILTRIKKRLLTGKKERNEEWKSKLLGLKINTKKPKRKVTERDFVSLHGT